MTAQFLAAWSAQILLLVCVGAVAALALRHPKARLLFWQSLLLLAVLLPVLEPWKPAPVEAITTSASLIVHVALSAAPPAPWYTRIHWRTEYLFAFIAAGAALRLLWMAAGLLRLRRYRLQAERWSDPPLYFAPRSVRWYRSDAVPGPVTYGWRHPSILLPRRVDALPVALREAIACHELVHIRRRDWLFVLAEEIVRAALWFHPAIWYILSQIQLAREQVVDREAVGITENRECYLDALIAVAGHKLQPDLVPATLFLKKRHLAVRVAEIVKEVSPNMKMSRSRIAANLAGVFSAALSAAIAAVWFFPITSPAQTMVDDPGITVDAGGTLVHRNPVHYPTGAPPAGTVTVEATLDTKGEVSDAHVVSGPDELRRSALSSVLGWHYLTTAGALPTVRISIRFDPPQAPAVAPARAAFVTPPPPPPPPLQSASSRIKSIEFSGISPEAEQDLRNRLQIHEGDTVAPADMQRISREVQEYDSHLRASFTMQAASPDREMALRIAVLPQANGSGPLPVASGGRSGGAVTLPNGQTAPQAQAASIPPGTIRVGGEVQSTKLVNKTTPAYPPLAKASRIQGTVELTVTIAPDGTVQNIELISGHPLLVQAATDAVKQWVYQPTLLNGNPVAVITQVNVNFTLSQ
ncbi:MAG TPA: M56 family metallopeptidase [Bryobacteraceae bacterium]